MKRNQPGILIHLLEADGGANRLNVVCWVSNSPAHQQLLPGGAELLQVQPAHQQPVKQQEKSILLLSCWRRYGKCVKTLHSPTSRGQRLHTERHFFALPSDPAMLFSNGASLLAGSLNSESSQVALNRGLNVLLSHADIWLFSHVD